MKGGKTVRVSKKVLHAKSDLEKGDDAATEDEGKLNV
jgi:hypothetical protein